MLGIFRSFRILTVKTDLKRYLLYAVGEVVLIFVGVTLSVWFTNWGEERKEKKIEKYILKELRNTITSDLQTIEDNLKGHKRAKASTLIILQALDKRMAYHDSLDVHFASTQQIFNVSNNSGPYENLKAVGLNIISNDSLRLQIIDLYDNHMRILIQEENENSNTFFSIFLPFNSTRFSGSHTWETMKPVDYETLITDKQYHYYMQTLNFFRDVLIQRNEFTVEEMKKVIKSIDQELKDK